MYIYICIYVYILIQLVVYKTSYTNNVFSKFQSSIFKSTEFITKKLQVIIGKNVIQNSNCFSGVLIHSVEHAK